MRNFTIDRSDTWTSKTRRKLKLLAFWMMAFFVQIGFGQIGTIQIGSGTATTAAFNNTVPITNYVYSYCQIIVTAEDYSAGGGVAGEITKLRFYTTSIGSPSVWANNWKVYLGNTEKTEFSSNDDWVALVNLQQVYEGAVTPVANNWWEITFTTPFDYTGGNLIVAIDEDTPGWNGLPTFRTFTSSTNSALYYRTDTPSENPNPAVTPIVLGGGALGRTATLPQMQFEGTLAPACPTPNTVTDVAMTLATPITGTITPNGTASGYLVVRSTDAILSETPQVGVSYNLGNSLGNGIVVYSGTETSFSDATTLTNTQYYYHTFAYNSNPGTCSISYSETSVSESITTCPGVPIIVGASNVRTSGATINWTPAIYSNTTGITYTVEVSTTQNFSSIYQTTTDLIVNSISLSGLTPNVTYYWRVKAVGASCDSNWANSSFIAQSSYSPIVVTGFTADVIADGIGGALNSTTNPVDSTNPAANNAYVSNSFKLNTSSTPITNGLPLHRKINSPNISGLSFILPDYAGNNSLRLPEQNVPGTLMFTEPLKLTDIYFAFTSGDGSCTVTAEILFDDSSSQIVEGIAFTNWDSTPPASAPAIVGNLPRVKRDLTSNSSGTNFKIFQYGLSIDEANQSKNVIGVQFTKTSTGTLSPVANIFAISGKIIGDCPILGATSVEDIEATSAELNWTLSNAGAGHIPADITYTIQIYSDSALTTPIGAPITGITTTEYVLTDLNPLTFYYFTIMGNNGDCDSAMISGNFKTACGIFTPPFFEGFENGFTHNTPIGECYTQQSITGIGTTSSFMWSANNTSTDYNRTPRTGSWNAFLRYSNEDWLFFPIELEAGTNYEFKFYARQDGSGTSNANVSVFYGATGTAADMTNSIIPATNLTNGAYQEISNDFTPTTSGVYYIGIKGYINGTPWYISIDDISLKEILPCPEIFTAPTASNPTDNSVDISWTAIGTIDIEYGPSGFTLGSGTLIENVATSSYTLNDLSSGLYNVYIRYNCTATDEGVGYWSPAGSFTIGAYQGGNMSSRYNLAPTVNSTDFCTPEPTITIEVPEGMQIASLQVLYTMRAATMAESGAIADAWMSEQRSFIYSPTLSAGETSLAQGAGNNAGNFNYNRTLNFANGATGSVDFVLRSWRTWEGIAGCNATVNYVVNGTWVILPTFEPLPCETPTDFSSGEITVNSVELTWIGSADSFTIEYGASGFAQGTGTTLNEVTSPFVLSDLDDNTEYDVYIKGVCTLNESEWVGPVTFTTLEEITTPPACDISVTISSSNWGDVVTWQLIDGSGEAVLSGGTYAQAGYSDTQTYIAINPPYTLQINHAPNTFWCDNDLDYLVTVGGNVVISGTIFDPCSGGQVNIPLTTDFTACIPSCYAPTALTHTQLSMSSAELFWTSDGDLFEVKWGETGFDVETEGTLVDNLEATTLTLEELIIDTQYQFYVRQDCTETNDGYSIWTGPYSFSVGYCTIVAPANYDSTGITQVTFGDINNPSNTGVAGVSNIYYTNFTNISTDVIAGESYDLSVNVNTSGNWMVWASAWIDWNNDGVFDTALATNGGEAYNLGSALNVTNGATSGSPLSIIIPDVEPGEYRMRIRAVYGTAAIPNPCENQDYSETEDYTIIVISDPCVGVISPIGNTDQTLDEGDTLANLEVDGENLVWYADEDLNEEIEDTTLAINGTTYYVVSQTETCQSEALAITVTVINPCAGVIVPTGDTEQVLNEGDTLANLEVDGENLVWYADEDLNEEIEDTTLAVDGVTYYVVSETDECQSEALPITVTVIPVNPCEGIVVPIPTGEENQTLNDDQTLADLEVDGENLQWYADEDLTQQLDDTHLVENEVTYYVIQVNENGCQSEALAITVQTLDRTDFTQFAFNFYPNPVNDILNLTSNSEISKISMFNMLGQQVTIPTNVNNTQVDMSGLPTGNYIISVTIEGVTKTFKVVKQ